MSNVCICGVSGPFKAHSFTCPAYVAPPSPAVSLPAPEEEGSIDDLAVQVRAGIYGDDQQTDEAEEAADALNALLSRLRAAEARRGAVVKLLERYGRHDRGCDQWPCQCGFFAALSLAGQPSRTSE